jgi:hypothetical protein
MPDSVQAHVAGRGTLKFPLGEPIPWALIDRVLAALLNA